MMRREERIEQARALHRQGDLERAERLYREVLAEKPEDPDANHLLGVMCHQRGEHETALTLIRRALAAREDHPPGQNNLGSVLKELGRYEEALAAFSRAVELQPDFAEACNNLGTIYQKRGRFDDAEAMYRRAVDLKPGYLKALNNLGSLFHQRRDFAKALEWYGKALTGNPDYPLTQYNLGCTLMEFGRLDEAEAAFRQVLAGDKDHFQALSMLGTLYHIQNKFHQALDVLQRAVAVKPEAEEAYVRLAKTYAEMNRYEEAERSYAKALALNPESAGAHMHLGMLYNQMGQIDQAQECLDQAVAIRPGSAQVQTSLAVLAMNRGEIVESALLCKKALCLDQDFAPAYHQLAQVVPATEVDQTAHAVSELLAKKNRPLSHAMLLHFAMAKLQEDLGEYESAAEHLVKANGLKRRTYTYSLDYQRDIVAGIRKVFYRETLHRLAGRGFASPVPVFIVGMPRSGTTLVEQILSSHPAVHGAGELRLFAETVIKFADIPSMEDGSLPPETLSLVTDDLAEVGRSYVEKLQEYGPGSTFITNKMPGNFLHLGLISLTLPQAKIIHLVRDPMDNCLSIYKKLFAHGHQYGYALEELGEYYLQYMQLMDHWRRVMPGRFLDLCYEDLVRDQEGATRKLLEYCGLAWHDDCLRYYEQRRPVFTASAVQVREPLTGRSVGMWKNYETMLSPLMKVLKKGMNVSLMQRQCRRR